MTNRLLREAFSPTWKSSSAFLPYFQMSLSASSLTPTSEAVYNYCSAYTANTSASVINHVTWSITTSPRALMTSHGALMQDNVNNVGGEAPRLQEASLPALEHAPKSTAWTSVSTGSLLLCTHSRVYDSPPTSHLSTNLAPVPPAAFQIGRE